MFYQTLFQKFQPSWSQEESFMLKFCCRRTEIQLLSEPHVDKIQKQIVHWKGSLWSDSFLDFLFQFLQWSLCPSDWATGQADIRRPWQWQKCDVNVAFSLQSFYVIELQLLFQFHAKLPCPSEDTFSSGSAWLKSTRNYFVSHWFALSITQAPWNDVQILIDSSKFRDKNWTTCSPTCKGCKFF